MDKPLLYSKTVIGFLTCIAAYAIQTALPELGVVVPHWLSGDAISVTSVLQWVGAAIGVIGARQAAGKIIVATQAEVPPAQ